MSVLIKLDKFRQEVGKVKKDGNNPFHKSSYATLDSVIQTIEEPMKAAGIGYYQTTEEKGLATVIYDVEKPDSTFCGFIPFLGATDMQKLGSAITYARRYGLVTMLGLEQEDDDGNHASGHNQNYKPQQQNQNYNNNQAKEPKQYLTKEQAKELVNFANDNIQDINQVLAFFKQDGLLKLTIKQSNMAKAKMSNGEFPKK